MDMTPRASRVDSPVRLSSLIVCFTTVLIVPIPSTSALPNGMTSSCHRQGARGCSPATTSI
jgi:hypothetical protein